MFDSMILPVLKWTVSQAATPPSQPDAKTAAKPVEDSDQYQGKVSSNSTECDTSSTAHEPALKQHATAPGPQVRKRTGDGFTYLTIESANHDKGDLLELPVSNEYVMTGLQTFPPPIFELQRKFSGESQWLELGSHSDFRLLGVYINSEDQPQFAVIERLDKRERVPMSTVRKQVSTEVGEDEEVPPQDSLAEPPVVADLGNISQLSQLELAMVVGEAVRMMQQLKPNASDAERKAMYNSALELLEVVGVDSGGWRMSEEDLPPSEEQVGEVLHLLLSSVTAAGHQEIKRRLSASP